MEILDLGCGTNKVQGAIGMDNANLSTVDVVHDLLQFPYPFESNFFDEIYLNHVIEHFNINQINSILNECKRLLKNDSKLIICVPHAFSLAAYTDPTHKMYFTFGSANFWLKDNIKSYYLESNSVWQLVSTSTRITKFDWKNYRLRKLDILFSKCLANRINFVLGNKNFPSMADRIVMKSNCQFVEIKWILKKIQ